MALLSPLSRADDTSELLKRCDKAYVACKDAGEAKDKMIERLEEYNNEQAKRLAELEDKQDSFFNSPIFWMITGAFVTGGLVYLTK